MYKQLDLASIESRNFKLPTSTVCCR